MKRAANRLADVQALLDVEARRGPTLLVTYKAAAAKLKVPDGSAVCHFGAIRGPDRFKGFETVIIAGREQPNAGEMENQARAIFGGTGEPLNMTGEYVKAERGYRMRDGSRRGARVPVHPDARGQALLEQVREREMAQAIDRLRLVHRERPARVLILSNVPLDITVDKLVTWRELIPPRFERAATRGDAVPLSKAELARCFPELWATAAAAEIDLRRAEKGDIPLVDSLTRTLSPFSRRVRYWRTPGQTKPYRVAVPEGADPEAALVTLVGPVLRWALDPPESVAESAPEAPIHELKEPPEMPAADPTPLLPSEPPTAIPPEWRAYWHERAGIAEHDGEVPRFNAERQASEGVRAMLAARLVTSCGIWGRPYEGPGRRPAHGPLGAHQRQRQRLSLGLARQGPDSCLRRRARQAWATDVAGVCAGGATSPARAAGATGFLPPGGPLSWIIPLTPSVVP